MKLMHIPTTKGEAEQMRQQAHHLKSLGDEYTHAQALTEVALNHGYLSWEHVQHCVKGVLDPKSPNFKMRASKEMH